MAKSGAIYGPTGSFKTSQVKWFSHYIYEVTGKSTLLLSCDGGGWSACEPEIQAGIIIPYRVETATIPLPIMQSISQGWWPSNPLETDPNRINLVPMDYTKVGGIAVEGWTSLSQVIMRYLPDKNISVGGEDRNKAGANMAFRQQVYRNGKLVTVSFGSNTRGDYGFVQNNIYGQVMNYNSLPVWYVLYTALEAKSEDEDRVTVYGPSIAGKKATSQCGAWVGDLLHAQDFTMARKQTVTDPSRYGGTMETTLFDSVVRYYFKRTVDPQTSIPFPAKPRVTPEKVAELEKIFPGGYFEPTTEWGIDKYLLACDALSEGQGDVMKEWREKVDQKRLGRGKNPPPQLPSGSK